MDIQFQTIVQFPMVPGQEINLSGAMWTCQFECTVIGWTLGDLLPVLMDVDRSPIMNSGELILSVLYKPRVEQVGTIETMILSKYRRLSCLDGLAGKTIAFHKKGYREFILITVDNYYIKHTATNDFEDGCEAGTPVIDNADLTISDLHQAKLIDADTMTAYRSEYRDLHRASEAYQADKELRKLARTLGLDKVKKILGVN